MAAATLTIDLNAITSNWKALDALSNSAVETAAVVKADAYGLGAAQVAQKLTKAGVKSFFVALASEGALVRMAVGNDPDIYVFSGLMKNDEGLYGQYNLIPLLNSAQQFTSWQSTMPNNRFGVQINTGMNRLGMEATEFNARRDQCEQAELIVSHLACADDPSHPQNKEQLQCFHDVTNGMDVKRSLAATGGTLMGSDYHFDLCRPGVGLYGADPYNNATPVVHLSIPVIQTRTVNTGECVGYSATWVAKKPTKVATVAAGYADGLIRALGNDPLPLWANGIPCPIIGRVSMDLLTVDVTNLTDVPDQLELLNNHQTVDTLAQAAGTIGYEILTSLGHRYDRVYLDE